MLRIEKRRIIIRQMTAHMIHMNILGETFLLYGVCCIVYEYVNELHIRRVEYYLLQNVFNVFALATLYGR